MQIHTEELADASRYLELKRHLKLEDMLPEYKAYLNSVQKFTAITPQTRILEIGTGTGWFPILCKKNGLQCRGIEISPQFVQHAREWGRANGVEPDIQLGNVEESDIGVEAFDVIIANSVFEHIEHWRLALQRVHKALAPGGLFFFISTNRFSLTSDEYSFPLYGWLPDSWRYKLRIRAQGPDIMKLGIDFNQFTYPQLRRAFREAGFREVYDRMAIAQRGTQPSGWKRAVVRVARTNPLLRELVLTFSEATVFACRK